MNDEGSDVYGVSRVKEVYEKIERFRRMKELQAKYFEE